MIATIEVWYDYQFKTWCIQCSDAEGNQVGELEYEYLKRNAVKWANKLQQENENSIVRVFKKDGEMIK